MSELQKQVLSVLIEAQGSVAEVMTRLPTVSRSYVNRIKQERWSPGLTQETGMSLQEFRDSLLTPNIPAITNLRDATTHRLMQMVKDPDYPIEPKELNAILTTILQYETRLQKVANPSASVLYQDNRSYEVQAVAEEVAQRLDIDELRAIAGVAAPVDITERNGAQKEN